MSYRQIVFTRQSRAELKQFEAEPHLQPKHARVQAEYTLISPGTELSWFSGMQREVSGDAFTYPVYSGYCHSGTITELSGDGVPFQEGDRIVSGAAHSSQVEIDTRRSGAFEHSDLRLPVARLPEEVPPELGPFAKIGEIAMTAIRVADFSLGDKVVVIGLGMLGNLTAQLFTLAGAEVLAVDLSPFRIERARACGISHIVNPESSVLRDYVGDWTDGRGADVTVECIGDSRVILESVQYTRRLGDIVLLGTPRQAREMNPSVDLWRAHMKGIELKGALRSLFYPMFPSTHSRYSVEDDLRQVVSFMARGLLTLAPLHTHTFSPLDCQDAFEQIQNDREHTIGVLFDWTRLTSTDDANR